MMKIKITSEHSKKKKNSSNFQYTFKTGEEHFLWWVHLNKCVGRIQFLSLGFWEGKDKT